MGPLSGVKVIELAGIGPGPFCAMMLADMGADVIRVDRAQSVVGGDPASPPADVLNRGRRSIGLDLKQPEGVDTLLNLVEQADALIDRDAALRLLDDVAITGELTVTSVRAGRVETIQTWGRPQSVIGEFKRLRAQ